MDRAGEPMHAVSPKTAATAIVSGEAASLWDILIASSLSEPTMLGYPPSSSAQRLIARGRANVTVL